MLPIPNKHSSDNGEGKPEACTSERSLRPRERSGAERSCWMKLPVTSEAHQPPLNTARSSNLGSLISERWICISRTVLKLYGTTGFLLHLNTSLQRSQVPQVGCFVTSSRGKQRVTAGGFGTLLRFEVRDVSLLR